MYIYSEKETKPLFSYRYTYTVYPSQREARSEVHTTFVLPVNKISKDVRMSGQSIAKEYSH